MGHVAVIVIQLIACFFSVLWSLVLTHWGRVTRIWASKSTIIDSDNGRRQAINGTNAGILFIGPLRTNFSEILIEIDIFSFRKMYLEMSSGNLHPFHLGLNVLTQNIAICVWDGASVWQPILGRALTHRFATNDKVNCYGCWIDVPGS